jgi:hypothetical protein
MGFLIIPRLLLCAAVSVGCIKSAIWSFLHCVGLSVLLEPEISYSSSWQETEYSSSLSEMNPSEHGDLIREWLPVTTFGEFAQRFHGEIEEEDAVCAVCLSRLEEEDEMRELCNCFHVFHRNCLEKWLHQRQTTCPLCRCCLIPELEPESERESADTAQLPNHQSWLVDSISFLFAQDLAFYPS